MIFIFKELWSTGYNWSGAGEQVHSFGNLGSTSKKLRKELRDSIIFGNQWSTDPTPTLWGPLCSIMTLLTSFYYMHL